MKFDGEPVVRHTDLATNNHASPQANTPPMTHAAQWEVDGVDCATILLRNDMKLHRHGDSTCKSEDGMWSEHYVENQALVIPPRRKKKTKPQFKNYTEADAPCLCMHSRWQKKDKRPPKIRPGQTTGTGHYNKGQICKDSLQDDDPNMGEFTDTCAKASVNNHENSPADPEERERIAACLVAVFLAHLQEKINETRKPNNKATIAQVRAMKPGADDERFH